MPIFFNVLQIDNNDGFQKIYPSLQNNNKISIDSKINLGEFL